MNVGIYIRLSDEDNRKNNIESESIKNQREILKKYVKDNNFCFVKEYIDDGYTGTDFNRPAFIELINDIENCLINCVITKDLSRLGRDFVKVGYYLYDYFPVHGIRYISILENYDNYKNINDDIAPFKVVFNDLYSKDLSRKCRSSLYSKMNKGEFIGSRPPYGYLKDLNDKNKLIIDHYASYVVKRIFNDYINGKGMAKIAIELTKEKIDVPSVYNSSNSAIISHSNIWTCNCISFILKNEIYTGNMVQHKYENISYKIHKKKKIPYSDRIIVKNTHEPIIDKQTFELVKRRLSYNLRDYNKKHEYLLSGLMKCKECGHAICIRQSGSTPYTFCNNYKAHNYQVCSSHSNNYIKIEKEILEDLKSELKKQIINYEKINFEMNKKEHNNKNSIDEMNKKIMQLDSKMQTLYNDRLNNIITLENYVEYKKSFENEKININELINNIKNGKNNKKNFTYDNLVDSFKMLNKVDKLFLQTLIHHIELSKEKEIVIYYNFCT